MLQFLKCLIIPDFLLFPPGGQRKEEEVLHFPLAEPGGHHKNDEQYQLIINIAVWARRLLYRSSNRLTDKEATS